MDKRAPKIHSSEDRISELPEPILHHILCYLSQTEAIRTCVLSKAWRYVGCTRPKLEFASVGSGIFDSALDRILQVYHDRNLRLDEFNVWLSEGNAYAASLLNKWIPMIIQNMCVKSFHLTSDLRTKSKQLFFELPTLILESDHIQDLSLIGCMMNTSTTQVRVYLQSLQTLRLQDVNIPEQILDNILSNCPLMENVSLLNCKGFSTIKLFSNKPANLTHFYFHGNFGHDVSVEIGNHIQTLRRIKIDCCVLSVSHTRVQVLMSDFFSCNLTELHLYEVNIPEELLDNILSNCPFIEDVSLSDCKGFERINLLNNKPTNLTSFYLQGDCLFSVSRNKPLEFARLTQLSLIGVQLSSDSFLCNLHCLEELELDECSGIKEFKLSSRSMKRLDINNTSRPFKATIDAPSIVSFRYEGILPQFISFAGATTSDDWKSEIKLWYEHSQFFNELYGLLKALSRSEIYLELDQIVICRFGSQLHIEESLLNNDIVGVSVAKKLPVAVEHLTINGLMKNMSSVPHFLNRLFRMFRPSFIHMGTIMMSYPEHRYREIAEYLFEERKTVQNYYWQGVLDGVSLQVRYLNQNEWEPVEITSFTEVSMKGAVRVHLKWRE